MSTPSGDTQCRPFTPVRGETNQHIDHTASRHSGPRKWLTSIRWAIGAGLHPKTNATTQALADDLAARMDYSTGHVRYCLEDTAARLRIDKATVKRHAKYLRELGSLAWVMKGTRRNVRREQGLAGYAATATIYAAVIPPAFDHAMGHRIIGQGYDARIIIDQRNTPTQATKEPVDTAGNSPVDNSEFEGLAPPSLTLDKESGQVQVVGGVTTTGKRADKITPDTPKTSKQQRQKRRTILGAVVTATAMHLGDQFANAVRRHIPWTRRSNHDQIRWITTAMAADGWTEADAIRFTTETGFTHRAGFTWQPARPHAVLAAALRTWQQEQEKARQHAEDLANAIPFEESTVYREMQARRAEIEQAEVIYVLPEEEQQPERTDDDRRYARMDWNLWPEVWEHFEEDELDALDLYGRKFVNFAIEQHARLARRQEALYV